MDVSKNLNPFLFDEPPSGVECNDPAKNPFLVGETYDYQPASYSSINPFSDNATDSSNIFASVEPFSVGVNPFGDILQPNVTIYSQPDTVVDNSHFDIFGNSSQSFAVEESLFENSTPQPPRPPRPPSPRDLLSGSPQPNDNAGLPGRPPPPRPPPPSKETKDLLQTVIGAIDATTDTLQDKLNTIKTPCPSPGIGIQHSRSPTPDIQITSPKKESDCFSTVFGQTIELSDPETDDGQEVLPTINKTTENLQGSEIDLFGDTINQAKPKTTQDILSLYKKPSDTDVNQVDLLSGDLLSDNTAVIDGNGITHETIKNGGLLISDIIDSKNDDFSKHPTEDHAPDEFVPCDKNEPLSEQALPEAGTSPEQISDKSGSEPTVIETNIYDTTVKGNDSIILSDYSSQNTFMPTDAIGEFEDEGYFQSNECQIGAADLPSAIFSAGSTPPLSELGGHRKESNGSYIEQIAPRRESMEAFTEGGTPRKVSIGSYTEQFSEQRGSIGSFTEKVSSRKESIGSYTEQGVLRKESIGSPFSDQYLPRKDSYTEQTIDRKSSLEPSPERVATRKESNGSFTAQVIPRKESVGSFTGQITPQQELFGSDMEHGSPRNAPIEALTEQITPIPSNVFNTEVGIVERNDTYMSDSVQRVEQKVSTPVNVIQPAQTDAGAQGAIFGDFPSMPMQQPSSGFSIFGDDISTNKSISCQESTGATLFETAAPAPNVGMSLFGAGQEATLDIFAESTSNTMVNPFAPTQLIPTQSVLPTVGAQKKTKSHTTEEEFDAFSARFDNVTTSHVETAETTFDPFTSASKDKSASPWGGPTNEAKSEGFGFGDNSKFDSFLSMNEPPPPPKRSPRRTQKQQSADSDEGQMNIVIKPISAEAAKFSSTSPVPVLAPPPAVTQTAFTDTTPRFNPFDRNDPFPGIPVIGENKKGNFERSDSQETPPTPLFEEDQSVPLETYPRTIYDGRSWEMYLRQPNKKKITGQRFWKKIFLKFTNDGALQLYNNVDDKEPFQELPLQPCYSVSDIGAQQFDQFGKIFTVKVQYIFYKERPGVRPGQISKAERITTKLSKFAQYAIAGDYEGVKEFASDVRKLGMPVEHAPQISQLLKLGTQSYEDIKLFASIVEENMFKLVSTRERALNYKSEEVQLTAVDETFVEQDLRGAVLQMVARVRIFFLSFLSGMTEVDLGINDLRKQGHEVVGRHDIIPVVTEEWIRLEDIEFHCTVDKEEFEKTRHIRFRPPDGCYVELMRYRVRPPKNRELPLQVKTKFIMQGKQVDIQCEILVPGFSGRKLGQVPCEDIAVRFPLPECWIYMFRVEKHFRYGSVKSAHRRTGKVKGIERLKGTVESSESALMEVTSGQAKYEHQHRAIVWRMSRLPKEGQGAYTVHQFTCKMYLTSYDQIPQTFDKHCMVEFTMPATTVSHCVMRSVSVSNDEPPEKYVRYLARHEYKVEIEFSSGSGPGDYIAATKIVPDRKEERKIEPVGEESSSDESG